LGAPRSGPRSPRLLCSTVLEPTSINRWWSQSIVGVGGVSGAALGGAGWSSASGALQHSASVHSSPAHSNGSLSDRAIVCVGSSGEPHWCEPLSLCWDAMSVALRSPMSRQPWPKQSFGQGGKAVLPEK